MPRGRALPLLAVLPFMLLPFLVVAAPVVAQVQSADQQRCTLALAKRLPATALALGKDALLCLKDGAKARVADVDACLAADRLGKVAAAALKTDAEFAKRCTGLGKDGAPRLPPWGPSTAAAVNEAATGETAALLRDALGETLAAATITEASDRDGARCQQALAKQLDKCRDARTKAFVACVGARLAAADAPDDLASCVADDPKGTVAKQCDLRVETKPGRFTVDGLRKTLATQCVPQGVSLPAALPGCAAADAEDAHACLARAAACRACRANATGSGLAVDCDLVDDGQANASCGGAPPIGRRTCTLDPELSGFSFDTSIFIDRFTLDGEIAVDCGAIDPASGRAACTCELVDIPPVPIVPGIGVACLRPATGCATGVVACDGGGAFEQSIVSDHDAGACTGNAGCLATCATQCAASGADVLASGCEGFCRGGSNADAACTNDAGCPGGTCIGADAGAHGGLCQCECLARTGEAAPGALRCELGVEIDVERAAPCGDGDLLFAVGRHCIPFTSEGAIGRLVDADAVAGALLPEANPNDIVGQRRTCDVLASSASGLVLASAMHVFDVPLAGDIAFAFTLGCE
jgi:hypothetical protein